MSSINGEMEVHYSWKERLHGYLSLARISNSPTVASNVLAGAALAGVTEPNGTVLLLVVAMILFYTAGMYLNDIFDYEIDSREHPERPLPSGLISLSAASFITIGLFLAAAVLLWIVGLAPFLAGLLLIGLIVLYDYWHKANPLSPLIMGGNRMMVYIVAFLAFSTSLTMEVLIAGTLLLLYIVSLTYIAKSETLPTFTKYWPAVLLFLPAAYFTWRSPTWGMLPLVALFVGWVAYSISFIYRSQGRSIGGGIVRLIAGIALYDMLVLGVAGSAIGVVLALAAFALTLFFQRYIKGT